MCGRFAQTNIIKATSGIVKTVIGKVDILDNFNISPVRLILEQNIEKANKLIFMSTIELAVVSSKGKITKLPEDLLSLI